MLHTALQCVADQSESSSEPTVNNELTDWLKLLLCVSQDLMIMGAPGSSYWTGSVLVYNVSSRVFAAYVDDDNTVLYGSYLGKTGDSHSSGSAWFIQKIFQRCCEMAPLWLRVLVISPRGISASVAHQSWRQKKKKKLKEFKAMFESR